MKKINILAGLMIGLVTFTACDSDRDDNPTLSVPDSFVLNTPAYSTEYTDLKTTNTLSFSWSQPAYGYTAATTYSLDMSLTGEFKDATTASDGTVTAATYYTMPGTFTAVNGTVDASKINSDILEAKGWKDDSTLVKDAPITVYFRCKAVVDGNTADNVYSNVVTANVRPYFVITKAAPPAVWYLIGGAIGDGKWTNSAAGLGKSVFPLDIDPDCTYDKATGKGTFIYTGYFETGKGFKLIGVVGGWDAQFGNSGGDGFGSFVYADGGSGNIVVPKSGWYKIVLDNTPSTPTLTITEVDDPGYTLFSSMNIAGDFNKWVTTQKMESCNPDNPNNHEWYYVLDATGGDTTAKFLAEGAWDHNWGTDTFPYGFGKQNGANIPVTKGSYVVFFNDATGCYQFVTK